MKQIFYNHSKTILEKSRVKLMYPPIHRAVHLFWPCKKIFPFFFQEISKSGFGDGKKLGKKGVGPPIKWCILLNITIYISRDIAENVRRKLNIIE